MSNPMCPYCGEQMEYYWDNNPMKPEGWYFCPKCHSRAPTAKTDEAAKAAAMKRHREKGEWIETVQPCGWSEVSCATCSKCGEDFSMNGFELSDVVECWLFCPNCGADMRKE